MHSGGFAARINLLPLLRYFGLIFQQTGKESEECVAGKRKQCPNPVNRRKPLITLGPPISGLLVTCLASRSCLGQTGM